MIKRSPVSQCAHSQHTREGPPADNTEPHTPSAARLPQPRPCWPRLPASVPSCLLMPRAPRSRGCSAGEPAPRTPKAAPTSLKRFRAVKVQARSLAQSRETISEGNIKASAFRKQSRSCQLSVTHTPLQLRCGVRPGPAGEAGVTTPACPTPLPESRDPESRLPLERQNWRPADHASEPQGGITKKE